MLAALALPILLTIVPVTGLDAIRSALEAAAVSEAERKSFSEKYERRFPAAPAEHVGSIEVFTPFREVVERARREFRFGNSYTEYRALQEAGESPVALRIVVRVVLPWNRVPLYSAAPFGSDFRLAVSYRAAQNRNAQVTAYPGFSVTLTCQGILCLQPGNPGVDGAVLEAVLPLAGVDPEGPLAVAVTAPSGETRTARFNLAKLK